MRRWTIALAVVAAVFVGCDQGPEFGKVNGKIVIPGHTADQIRVEFHPDALAGTEGLSSVGETDAEGQFTLTCAASETVKEGAIVGKHRVVLQDLRLARSETGKGIPQRFNKSLAAVLSTPLTAEVKAGEQEIVLDLSK